MNTTTNTRTWILGAPDPEMEMIEELLRACGETVQYAEVDGQRVHPGNAYRCPVPAVPEGTTAYAVECIDIIPKKGWMRVDHHRPGDPGYGRPPEDFMTASSIGQVVAELARLGRLPTTWRKHDWTPGVYYYAPTFAPAAYSTASPSISRWIVGDRFEIPAEIILAAAADHCLAHAYAGDCPGVDPDALMRWRAETRAAHQGRSVDDVLADIALARRALQEAKIVPCVGALDLRHAVVPELPEAASREGVAYLATVADRDGREKVVLGGATSPKMVRAFLDHWAPAQGLVDTYGDPARGFAGGYLS